MLHILWLILKFILILLGILLGLVLLVLLLVLFCPVCYRANVQKSTSSLREYKKTEAMGKISWLFGLVSFELGFQKEQFFQEFYLFHIPVLRLIRKFGQRKKRKQEISSYPESEEESSFPEKVRATAEKQESERDPFIETISSDKEEDDEFYQEIQEKGRRFFFRLGQKVQSAKAIIQELYQKLQSIPPQMQKVSHKISHFKGELDWWNKFLNHPRVRKALSLFKSSCKGLLKHIFPRKLTGQITFGASDPKITGDILAFLGMTMPLHRNCIQITPVFQNQNILQGHIDLKGRIYGIMLVKTALQLYFNKNIKYVIQKWKHK